MLRASVIGCGHGGGLSIEALQRSTVYHPPTACDVSPETRRKTSDRFPTLQLFDDLHEMLAASPADVVCIATPAPTHEAIARTVIESGVRGLLLEKPLACSSNLAANLLNDIRCADLPLVVPHGMLVLPAPQEVKQRLHDGSIGRLEMVEVQNAVDLLNAGIHWLVYLIDCLENDKVETIEADFDVHGHVINDGVQVESRGTTCIDMRSGIRILLESGNMTRPTSDVLPDAHQRGALFRLTGSKGRIELSAWAGSYWIQCNDSAGELVERPMPLGLTYHQLFLEQLADNIIAGTTDYYSAELSLASLRVIGDAYGQHNSGDWWLGIPAATESDEHGF